jgi:hypothetical protein
MRKPAATEAAPVLGTAQNQADGLKRETDEVTVGGDQFGT